MTKYRIKYDPYGNYRPWITYKKIFIFWVVINTNATKEAALNDLNFIKGEIKIK